MSSLSLPAGWRGQSLPALGAMAGGAVLGTIAVGYGLRHQASTELAIGAIVIALVCAIVGDPRRFLLALVALDLPLEWGKNTHWDPVLSNMGVVSGFQVSVTTFALAGLYALWALKLGRGSHRAPVLRPARPLIVYVAANVISLVAARNRVFAGYQLEMLTQTLLLFIYVVSQTRTREDLRLLVTWLLAGFLIESLLMVAMYATGWSPSFLGLKNHVDPAVYGGRVGGTFGAGPNEAAAFLGLMLPLALGVLAMRGEPRLRRLALVALPVGTVALLATGSRGGLLSFAVSTALLGIWAARRRLLTGQTLLVAGIGAVALGVAFWGPISQRVVNDQGAAGSRIPLVRLAEKVIVAHPLLGVGINNYGLVLPSYAGPQFSGVWLAPVHDKYLLVWAEAGIGALVAFLWFLLESIRRGRRGAQAPDPWLATLAAGLGAGIAGQLLHMAVDVFQDRAAVEGLWLVAGLLAAVELVHKRETRAAGVT